MTTLALSEIRSVGLAGGVWHRVEAGTLRADVHEILGERTPTVSFVDSDSGRTVVAPRSAVVGYDGETIEVRDPDELAADAARAARKAWLDAGAVEFPIGNAVIVFQPGWRFTDAERVEMHDLLDKIERGQVGGHNVAYVVDRLLDRIVIDGQAVPDPRELVRRSPSYNTTLFSPNFCGRLRQILAVPRPASAA